MTTEKTLLELSQAHLTEAINAVKENNVLLSIAEAMGNKNQILKLRFQKTQLENTRLYWESKVKEDSQW